MPRRSIASGSVQMKLAQIVILVTGVIISQAAFSQQGSSNIRSVDFSNFTYPWTPDLSARKSFTLKNGELPPTRNKDGLIDETGMFFQEVK